MDGDDEFGEYIDEDDMEGFGGGEEDVPQLQTNFSTEKTAFTGNNFVADILESNELRSLMLGKLVTFKNTFDYANFSEGHFLEFLRAQNFMVDKAIDKYQEKVYTLLENPKLQKVELDPSKQYTCNLLFDYYDAREIRHFGCGHTFHEECMDEYITEEIKRKGPTSIETRCPLDDCNLLITENVVESSCKKPMIELFRKFTIDDFISRAPYVVPCVASNCYYYFVVPDKCVTADQTVPQKGVICKCGTAVCVGCSKVGHEPLSCRMFEDWTNSSGSIQDALNSNWKKHNTKSCPGCHIDIQKNQGCMHMTCAKCRHEFCWLCLGDWKTHGSNTGGFFSCNVYKPEKEKDEDEKTTKKLQFFYDRFYQHKKSLEVTEEKYRDMTKKLKSDTDCIVSKMNNIFMPGSLDFYFGAFKSILKARSFVVYTYPLAYFIKNEVELSLFLQTQYMLEFALEKLDKFCESVPIESLIVQDAKKGLYHSPDFPEKRQTLLNLVNSMEKQFTNANKEFNNPEFLTKIAINKQKADFMGIIDNRIKGGSSTNKKPDPKKAKSNNDTNSWLCTICTYYNENSNRDTCTMCGRRGKPRNVN